MNKKTIRAKSPSLKANPLTRSARVRLMRSVDFLIAHFEASKNEAPVIPVNQRQSKLLDRHYRRLSDCAMVLNQWHSESAYVNESGLPKAIPKNGKLSISNLALDTLGDVDRAQQTSSDLLEFGLVKRIREKYIPDRRSAVVDRKSPLILAHATSAVTRYINTVAHNVSGQKPNRYERQVAEAQIPSKDLPQFLRFVEQQGQYFIDAIDDWLTSRVTDRSRTTKTIAVGVGAFAFVEPPEEIIPPPASPSTRPRRSR